MARQTKRAAVALKSVTGSPALRRNKKKQRSGYVGDLREWLAKVDDLGELQSVPGADWNKEIGAISQINYQRRENPALLFDDIKDYSRGYRVLTSSVGSTRRLALAFRFSTDLDKRELIEAFRGKPLQWEKDSKSYRPRAVDSGPVSKKFTKAAPSTS
jgi:3-polyprenyl-4-hydroxybenzoate decarboxylase